MSHLMFYKCLNSSRTSVEWFQNYSRNGLMVCSRTVLELTLVCSRTVPEQIFRTFMEQLLNTPHKLSHLTFFKCLNSSRTSVEWFQNYSRNVLMVCSRTVLELTLVCSRTDLEQTFRIFLEQL